MVQTPGESDTKYLKRVIAAAKLCDFDEDKIAESVADVIQRHALNIKVREAGRKILRKGGSLTELIGEIRGYEVDKTNEDIFVKTQPQAAVGCVQTGVSYHQRTDVKSMWPRGESEYIRREDSKPESVPCWRCTGHFHSAANCHVIDKICHNCQKVGHIGRACQEMPAPIPLKRRSSEEGESSTWHKKIAAVPMEEDDVEKNLVSDYST